MEGNALPCVILVVEAVIAGFVDAHTLAGVGFKRVGEACVGAVQPEDVY